MMPDLDGWTVLAAIKGDPELAGIPVVLMSIVDQKNRGYALGAADYLVKPVDRATLGGDAEKHLRRDRGPGPSGRCLDHSQIRRHWPWAGHQPAFLPPDGRRSTCPP